MKQFLIFLEPTRPDMFFGPTKEERALVMEHFRYLQDLLGEGKLILAGLCQDGPPGIVVLEAEHHDAADAIAAGDPAVKAGLFKAEVRPYKVSLMREP